MSLVLSAASRGLLQDKLEHYTFKLRIAVRKRREAKVAKINKKIERLKRQLSGETACGSGDDGEEVRTSRPCPPVLVRHRASISSFASRPMTSSSINDSDGLGLRRVLGRGKRAMLGTLRYACFLALALRGASQGDPRVLSV